MKPKVGDLRIVSTGKTLLELEATVNFTNPTPYAARIPYVNIHILKNGSIIGDATLRNVTIGKGNNPNVVATARWDPTKFGGEDAQKIGRELLSQYISGYNTTLTLQTHENTIPSQPGLGIALSKFSFEAPMPRLSTPSDGSDDDNSANPHFIRDTTFHLLSSTAQFTLVSPFQHSTMYIETLNATALYNHTEVVGRIDYDLPFKVPPGISESPRLPVDWSFDSVGYEELKSALGGSLKLDARGTVGIRMGNWRETIWYIGRGIGASVRL